MNIIFIEPKIKGIDVVLTNMTTHEDPHQYDDVTLEIVRAGDCGDDCKDVELEYKAHGKFPHLQFFFDNKIFDLCRGRYEGILKMGCYEFPDRIDFFVGQDVGFDVKKLAYKRLSKCFDEILVDPSCCNQKSCCCTNVCGDNCGQTHAIKYSVVDSDNGSYVKAIIECACEEDCEPCDNNYYLDAGVIKLKYFEGEGSDC